MWSINIYTLHLLKFPLLVVFFVFVFLLFFFHFAFICHIKRKNIKAHQKNHLFSRCPDLHFVDHDGWLARTWRVFGLLGFCHCTVGVALSLHPPWRCNVITIVQMINQSKGILKWLCGTVLLLLLFNFTVLLCDSFFF